jgi:hypothetical protein
VQDYLKSYLYLPNGCIEIDRVFCEENTNEINSIEVEVENENIGVNPYQFEPYDSDSSSSQTQDSNSDESDHDRYKNRNIDYLAGARLLEVLFISPERLHRNRSGFLRSSLETLFYQLV